MKRATFLSMICGAQTALLAAALLMSGCNSHPDDQAAVYSALLQSNISSVMVKEDRHGGVLTLTGIVANATVKSQAVAIAGQAAPGYKIVDEITVKPIGP